MGLWLYGVVASVSVVLDAIAGAPLAHHIAVILGAGVVFTLACLNRSSLRKAVSADSTLHQGSGEAAP